jgi:hypothetical protein
VIAAIQKANRLAPNTLRFHNQLGSPKTCPGSGITYTEILADVTALHQAPAPGTRAVPAGKAARASSVFVVDESRIRDALQVAGASTRAVDDPQAGMDDVEDEEAVQVGMARDGGLVEPVPGTRDAADKLDAAALVRLRPHVINLVQGEFIASGIYQTTQPDVDALFADHLVPRAKAATKEKPLRVMLWAHGGLVSEKSGLRGAMRALDWWRQNGVYPIHFIWETGAMETIKQIVTGAGSRAPAVSTRDLWDHTTDPLVERLSRPLGATMWSGMKRSAERASAPGGGARYVAEKLAALVKAGHHLEVHAAGHSAGSIFHAHLLPELISRGVPIHTLHLLAPAVRVDTFNDQLQPHIGAPGGISRCAMFTMSQDWEKRDNCAKVYRKSLLYLVSLAFEPASKTPILGLEESIRNNPQCLRLFGLDGAQGKAEVIWSKSVSATGRHSARATVHGDFDEDPGTMNSVLRRVLKLDDVARIHPFPEPDASRAVAEDEEELPADLALFLKAPSAVPTPAPAAAPDAGATAKVGSPPAGGGNRFALCVGINTYPTAPLFGCVADAERWEAELRRLGFSHIASLHNEKATREAITRELRTLVQRAQAGDVVVFQFAGHGTQLPDEDGDDDSDDQDEALCPIDFDDGQFVIDDDIKEIFAALPAGVNLTCFIDCCHSGTITRFGAGRSGRVMGVRGDAPRPRFVRVKEAQVAKYRKLRAAAKRSSGKRAVAVGAGPSMHEVVFSACRADQVAFESGGQGDFTRIATELLADGHGRESHADFHERVVREFGQGARQEPQLDCSPARRDGMLLTPLNAEV